MCDGTHTQDSVYTDWHQDKFSFRRRYNLKKPDWPKYENHVDKCIAKITPTPETYEQFVNLVRRVSQKNMYVALTIIRKRYMNTIRDVSQKTYSVKTKLYLEMHYLMRSHNHNVECVNISSINLQNITRW